MTEGGRQDTSAREADLALRVVVAASCAEAVGAVLMDMLGSFQEEPAGEPGSAGSQALGDAVHMVALLFYPGIFEAPSDEAVLAALPAELRTAGKVRLEWGAVPRDWVEGWKEHFRPSVIGRVRIRPPWEPEAEATAAPGAAGPGAAGSGAAAPVDVVINPGLGFGTGLHPTTRGTLRLLQETAPIEERAEGSRDLGPRGPLVDSGTGSGILAIAAAKLGWRPVVAFDNDPVALLSARENVEMNGVEEPVLVRETEVAAAPLSWFAGATVLANMTLEPVLCLVRRLAVGAPSQADGAQPHAGAGPQSGAQPATGADPQAGAQPATGAAMLGRPLRLLVSGILAGTQEQELLSEAARCGFAPGRRLYEAEWVSMELLPLAPEAAAPETAASRASAPIGGPAGGAPARTES